MIEYFIEKEEINIVEEDDNEIYDIACDIVNELNSSNNEEPVTKKIKISNDEYEQIERYCMHKKYGCRQCYNNYHGDLDIEYHQKLDILFNRMKETLKFLNKTV